MGSRDPRRFMGPEKTTPYTLLQCQKKSQFLDSDNLRRDGRTPADARKQFMSVGVITQAKGSAYVEIGDTKVVCGVYGPKEVQRGNDFKMTCQVLCEVKFAPFSCTIRKSPQPDRRQKEMSRQLKETLEAVIVLEKFPKSQIDVFVTVIEDEGGLLSACITAAGLALCHANIDVYDIVTGASMLWHKGILYVDPSRHEEECERILGQSKESEGGGSLTVGVMPTHASGQVALMLQEGEVSPEAVIEGLNLAVESSQKIYTLSRQTLLDHVESALQDGK
ncbi:unnamed protein product [Meganyctiphanes norvegica]|uniref:Exoribonuclease phosphorolytic domain-containing protein n=1 Tax=Meganyctiphanes norvegica TaxID=48144 RepID=A0AAV2PSA8_MEGNR